MTNMQEGRSRVIDRLIARQRGMTMVELMVALLLGLVTTYFIAQVFAVAEGQKRTATFGSDAQVNGAVALHTLKRHLQNSGYGLISAADGLGCTIKGEYGSAGSTTAVPSMTLAPVIVTPSATASAPSDVLTILASNKTDFAVPNRVMLPSNPASGQRYVRVDNSAGVKVGDVMMTVPQTWDANHPCTLFTVAEDTSAPDTTLSTKYVPMVAGAASSFNHAPASVWPVGGLQSGDWVVNMGQTMRRMVFSVSGDNLQVVTWTQLGVGTGEQLQSGIVLLKALYGRDTNADGVVDTYDTTTPTTKDEWKRVLAIRVAVVARSGQRERDIVTTAAPNWNVGANVAVAYTGVPGSAATTCTASAANCVVTLPLSHLPDWQYYRYKVFETVVPIRNLIWNLV